MSETLAARHPNLAAEVHPDSPYRPDEVSCGSNKKLLWKCANHREPYECSVKNRVHGKGCPFCVNKKILIGYNDLSTTHPHLVDQWADAMPVESVHAGSTKVVSWKCPEGHTFNQEIRKRVAGVGCGVCRRRKVIPGINDLATTHPDLLIHPSNTTDITTIHHGQQDVSVVWSCDQGHPHTSSPYTRTTKGYTCKKCKYIRSGSIPLTSANDEVLVLWSGSNSREPETYSIQSSHKALWNCENGHTWEAPIYSVVNGNRCSQCSMPGVSKVETAIYIILRNKVVLSDLSAQEHINHKKVDMYSPSHNLMIEYDGAFWHKDSLARDTAQTEFFLSLGYRVVRIREDPLPFLALNHDRLLQLSHTYSRTKISDQLVDNIIDWAVFSPVS